MEGKLETQLMDIISDAQTELRTKHLTDNRDYTLYIHPDRFEQLKKEISGRELLTIPEQYKTVTYMGIKLKIDFILYNEVWITDDRLVRLHKDEHILKFKIE